MTHQSHTCIATDMSAAHSSDKMDALFNELFVEEKAQTPATIETGAPPNPPTAPRNSVSAMPITRTARPACPARPTRPPIEIDGLFNELFPDPEGQKFPPDEESVQQGAPAAI